MGFAFPEYESYDALGLAELIAQGEMNPTEVLQAAIERAIHFQPQLNFIANEFYDIAKKNAVTPFAGPLAGVPFIIKDLLVSLEGQPLTYGSSLLRNYYPSADSELIKRYKQAGLNIFAQTTAPEFGLSVVTESAAYGTTKNPRHPDITSGGSSGGSAAAVAAGVVPVAHGNDGGGSIRIPASCCGLYGMKPSRGRVPLGPFVLRAWQGCAIDHALTRTVRDSALLLDIAGGASLAEPFITPPSDTSYLACLDKPTGKLKIAYHPSPMDGIDVDPDCQAAVMQMVDRLQADGHELIEAAPEINFERLTDAFLIMVSSEVANLMDYFCESVGSTLSTADIEYGTRIFAELGVQFSAKQLNAALQYFDQVSLKIAKFFQTYDAFVLPVLAKPPAKHGEYAGVNPNLLQHFFIKLKKRQDPLGFITQAIQPVLKYAPFTGVFNVAGTPAASIPGYVTKEGYPIGVQLVSGFGRDELVLQLSNSLL